eukprot:1140199-Pelagomonas_calceolata.AAC.3
MMLSKAYGAVIPLCKLCSRALLFLVKSLLMTSGTVCGQCGQTLQGLQGKKGLNQDRNVDILGIHMVNGVKTGHPVGDVEM